MHFGDRLELRLEAHPARLPGWPENGYETEEAAERYDRSEIARQDGERRAAALEIDPARSVLDIGAGPGTLALPWARRARQVTAVEPSLAMVKRLERHIAEGGISNIRILPKSIQNMQMKDCNNR